MNEQLSRAALEEIVKIYKKALFDVLDGNSAPHDIRANTGLPDQRCKEISLLYRGMVLDLDKDPNAF
jgi:hypothetical protein